MSTATSRRITHSTRCVYVCVCGERGIVGRDSRVHLQEERDAGDGDEVLTVVAAMSTSRKRVCV